MDDLSPGVRSLLQAADGFDDPSPEDAQRVRRAVLTRVGAIGVTAAVVTAGSTQAKAASIMSIAAKLTAALAVTAGGVVATWTYVNHSHEVAVSAPAPVKAKAVTAPMTQAPVPAAEAPIVSPEDVKLEEETPAPKSARTVPHAAKSAEKSEPAKTEPSAADLEAEMKLIRGADAALRAGRASEALSLLAQHQAEHPHASLAHEREGLRAIANCQLSAPGSGAVAERFLERAPRSPLAPRLKSACRIGD
jgi:type IV secretory pathway VirB10-like protein